MFSVKAFDDRPAIVIWEVAQRCALACRHCRAEAQRRRDPRELVGDEIEALLDQVAEAAPRFFILTGGDPASRPDLLQIIRRAVARGLRVAISPSATPRLLTEDFLEIRRAGVDRISLSLDGASEETHDAFRGIRGTWDWTRLAMDKAGSAGLEFQINTTISRANVGEWDAFTEVIRRIKPAMWSIFLLVPTGRARREEMLDAAETEDLLTRLAGFEEESGIPVKTTEAPQFRRIKIERARSGEAVPWRFAPTNDGRGFVFISHRGDIRPSGFLPVDCGNVRTGRLLDVYRNSGVFRALRDADRLEGKCGRCEYRRICGGSRARAFAWSGGMFAEEPCCPYQPAGRRVEAL
jgi:radical SAM protein with 4Fe4S-binding SPASM domain